MVKIDMTQLAKDSDGEVSYKEVTRGKYNVESVDYSVFETKDTSNHPETEYWSIHWEIFDDEEFDGKYVFGTVMLPCMECMEAGELVEGHQADKKGNENYPTYTLFNILRATVGQHKWTMEDIEKGAIDVKAEDLMGLKLRVRYGKQKGSDYMEIKSYMPLGEGDGDDNLLP